MLRLSAVLLACLVSAAAYAQAPPSPELRALNMRLGSEINANLQCTTQVLTLQDEIKALKDKYEPKKDEKK